MPLLGVAWIIMRLIIKRGYLVGIICRTRSSSLTPPVLPVYMLCTLSMKCFFILLYFLWHYCSFWSVSKTDICLEYRTKVGYLIGQKHGHYYWLSTIVYGWSYKIVYQITIMQKCLKCILLGIDGCIWCYKISHFLKVWENLGSHLNVREY